MFMRTSSRWIRRTAWHDPAGVTGTRPPPSAPVVPCRTMQTACRGSRGSGMGWSRGPASGGTGHAAAPQPPARSSWPAPRSGTVRNGSARERESQDRRHVGPEGTHGCPGRWRVPGWRREPFVAGTPIRLCIRIHTVEPSNNRWRTVCTLRIVHARDSLSPARHFSYLLGQKFPERSERRDVIARDLDGGHHGHGQDRSGNSP